MPTTYHGLLQEDKSVGALHRFCDMQRTLMIFKKISMELGLECVFSYILANRIVGPPLLIVYSLPVKFSMSVGNESFVMLKGIACSDYSLYSFFLQ